MTFRYGRLALMLGPFIAAALWPTARFLLLLPQRRADSVDENRPI